MQPSIYIGLILALKADKNLGLAKAGNLTKTTTESEFHEKFKGVMNAEFLSNEKAIEYFEGKLNQKIK